MKNCKLYVKCVPYKKEELNGKGFFGLFLEFNDGHTALLSYDRNLCANLLKKSVWDMYDTIKLNDKVYIDG